MQNISKPTTKNQTADRLQETKQTPALLPIEMASGALCFFFFCKCTFQGDESRKGLLCMRQVPLLPGLCGACWEHAGMQGRRKGCGEGWQGYGRAKGCPSRCLSLGLWKGLFLCQCPEVSKHGVNIPRLPAIISNLSIFLAQIEFKKTSKPTQQ